MIKLLEKLFKMLKAKKTFKFQQINLTQEDNKFWELNFQKKKPLLLR